MLLLASGCFALIPLDRKRIRARWAKFVLVLIGVLGVSKGMGHLTLHKGWLHLSSQGVHMVTTVLTHLGGLSLGFILSLIFSGQLLGTKASTESPIHAPLA